MAKPQEEPELQVQIDAVSDILQTFEKVLRAYRMYAADHVTVDQFETKAFEKISAFLQNDSELTLVVKPYEFHFGEKPVYHNTNKQENFSFKFHQDGIRQLSFIQGITKEELKAFFQILRTDYESYEFCDEDTVTLLWKNAFEHISYVVVETFAEAGQEAQDLETTLAQMAKDALRDESQASISSLLSGAVPTARRRLKRADAEEIMNLPDLDVARVSQEGMDQARSQVGGDDDVIVQRMILVLLRVLITEEREKEFRAISTVVRRMIESMSRLGNFGLAAKIYTKLKELADSSRNPSAANTALMKSFYDEMNDRSVIEPATKAASGHEFSKFDDFGQFVAALSVKSAPVIFELFKSTDKPDFRSKLVVPLASIGTEHADLFASTFQTPNSNLALATLDLLSSIGLSKTAPQIKRAFHHKDPHVRSKSLDILAQEGAEHAKGLCLNALKDAHAIVRMKALKLLVDTGDKKLAKPIFELTRGAEFDARDLEEKKQVYTGLGRLGGAALLPIFRDELKGGMLDRTEKAIERRIAAAWGLLTVGGDVARATVVKEKDRKLVPNQLKAACEQALLKWPKEKAHA
ncbi:MAG TPA: hypothetical protein VI895_07035 [Bdellovibrionota bacterium]|nr:hypothetical protein [Bdellovibrionota bacterium]